MSGARPTWRYGLPYGYLANVIVAFLGFASIGAFLVLTAYALSQVLLMQ